MLESVSSECGSPSAVGSSEWALAEVVDQIAARLQRGEPVSVEEYTAQYPQWAEPLRRLLPALEALAMAGSGERRQANEDEGTHCKVQIANCKLQIVASGGEPNAQDLRPKTQDPPSVNPKRLDDFELLREVGRGGMGIVYEARQVSLARRVAVKVLPQAAMLDPRQLQRFQNEARAAAQLNHPHIVDVICVGCAEGVHYFAMRFVDGQTLAEVVDQCKLQNANRKSQNDASGNPKSKIQNPKCVEWIAQAAEALEHAHSLGIVHRDVKPANLLIDRDGKLWVTDFGLARFGEDAGLTMTGDVLGTLRYMSPEQALGQRAAIDDRSDVYALGATLYELLALRPVFDGDDRSDLLRQIAFAEPRPLRKLNPRIPRDLETITLKALEKTPGDRYAAAGEVAGDLRRFLRGEPILAKPPTVAQRGFKWCWRHRPVVAAAAAVLVLAVVGLSVSTVLISRSRDEAVAAGKLLEVRNRENRRMLSAVETRLALQAYQRGELDRAGELLERQLARIGIRENSGHSGARDSSGGNSPPSHEAGYALSQTTEEDFRDFTWHWLRGAIGARLPLLRSFDDYPSEIYEIDYSPDGMLLAAACHRKIIVRDVKTGAVRYEIAAHDSSVNTLDISPDGALLASVGDDRHVRLWDLATGMLAADLGEHDCQATAIGFSPDGLRLASGDDRGLIRIWDVAGRREEKVIKGHTGKIDGAAFADHGTLVTTSGDTDMIGWQVDTGRKRWQVTSPFTPLTPLAISPGGTTVAAGDHIGSLGLWNAIDGRALAVLSSQTTMIQGVAFSFDGKLIAAGHHDGIARVWDAANESYIGQTAPHSDRVWSVAFSPDGRTLATASRDRSVKLWGIAADCRHQRLLFKYNWARFAFSPTGRLAIAADENVWELSDSVPLAFPSSRIGQEEYPVLAWLQGRLVVTTHFGELKVFDLAGKWDLWARRENQNGAQLSVSPDGNWVATGGELWRANDQSLVYRYDGSPVVFTSDSKFAIFCKDKKVLKLKLDNMEESHREIAEVHQTGVLALSDDDRLLALANHDSTIDLIDLDAGAHRTLAGHERPVGGLGFSPDGRTLASGGSDGTVRLWRVDVGEPLGVLARWPNGSVHQIAFSPDGTHLAAAGCERSRGALSLWEIEPEQP